MRKNYIAYLIMIVALANSHAQNHINFDVSSTAGTGWIGYMNVSNLPSPFGDGAYQFGSSWGTPDLVAISDTDANTVTLKPNRIGDPDPYWQTGNLNGNKMMDASFYLEDDTLAGTAFTFNGEVISNTINSAGLDVPITYQAFIKVYAADYSSFTTFGSDLSVGNFTISLEASDSAPGDHVQYGFTMVGPNIALDPSFDTQYDALGSIVIGENTTLSISEPIAQQVRLYPNPAQDQWHVKANKTIALIEVFNVLGKQLMALRPNALQTSIDAAEIPQGVYFARIHSGNGVETYRLIKK